MYFLNSPTWIILQMCFVLKKHHVWTLDDFLCLQANEPICLDAFAVSKKQTLDALRIQLCSSLIWHLRISRTTANAHMGGVRHPSTPRLLGCLTIHGLGWTPVAHVHRIIHRLRPKFMAEALDMNHGLRHLHDGLVRSFHHAVLLLRVR